MSRVTPAVLLSLLLTLSLGGCSSLTTGDFDPTDIMPDWFNTKKKLAGERKPVFPEGVPGVVRGVPQELMRGNQQADTGLGASQALVQPEEQPKARPKSQPKPKPAPKAVAATEQSRPTSVTVRRSESAWPDEPPAQRQQQPASQWPDPPAAQRQQPASQWPDPPGAQRQTSGGGVQWPDPPAPR